MITLVLVLKNVDKANVIESCFERFLCKCKKFFLSIASKNYLLILEKVRSFPPIL